MRNKRRTEDKEEETKNMSKLLNSRLISPIFLQIESK